MVIKDLEAAEQAIDLIQVQGEGTDISPANEPGVATPRRGSVMVATAQVETLMDVHPSAGEPQGTLAAR